MLRPGTWGPAGCSFTGIGPAQAPQWPQKNVWPFNWKWMELGQTAIFWKYLKWIISQLLEVVTMVILKQTKYGFVNRGCQKRENFGTVHWNWISHWSVLAVWRSLGLQDQSGPMCLLAQAGPFGCCGWFHPWKSPLHVRLISIGISTD